MFVIYFFTKKNCKLKPYDIMAYQTISGFWPELEFFCKTTINILSSFCMSCCMGRCMHVHEHWSPVAIYTGLPLLFCMEHVHQKRLWMHRLMWSMAYICPVNSCFNINSAPLSLEWKVRSSEHQVRSHGLQFLSFPEKTELFALLQPLIL